MFFAVVESDESIEENHGEFQMEWIYKEKEEEEENEEKILHISLVSIFWFFSFSLSLSLARLQFPFNNSWVNCLIMCCFSSSDVFQKGNEENRENLNKLLGKFSFFYFTGRRKSSNRQSNDSCRQYF